MMGPVVGPLSGAMLQSDMYRARCSSFAMSTTVPGLFEIKAAPNRALGLRSACCTPRRICHAYPTKRQANCCSKELARAQGMIMTVEQIMHTMYTFCLP